MKERENYTIEKDHSDLQLLSSQLGCQPTNLRKHFKRTGDGFIAENYFPILAVDRWIREDKERIQGAIERANEAAKEVLFEITGWQHKEVEEDRIWPASFSFRAHKRS